MVEGPENTPKAGSCADAGMLTTGAGLLETARVAFSVIDPDESVAVRPMASSATAPVLTSAVDGVPDKVRVVLSSNSQFGSLDNL